MLKLLPILMPVNLPAHQIELLPKFDEMPCEVIYNVQRKETQPTPDQNFTIHSFPPDRPRVDLQVSSYSEMLEISFSHPMRRNIPRLSEEDSKFVFDEGRRTTWASTEAAALYTSFATRSLLFDGYSFAKMDMDGPVRIVIGKGYAFYLMGEQQAKDPTRRFGTIPALKDHYTEIAHQIAQSGIEADLFVGVTLWGEKNMSSHRRLQITQDIRSRIPKACVGISPFETLAPIWPKSAPNRVHYTSSSTVIRPHPRQMP